MKWGPVIYKHVHMTCPTSSYTNHLKNEQLVPSLLKCSYNSRADHM